MSKRSTAIILLAVLSNIHSTSAQQPIRDQSGTDLVPPRIIKEVRPQYPGNAAEQGVEGEVILRVVIATDGTVHDVKVVHGLPQLISAAEHAVSQWQFEPARKNGVAIPSGLVVHVHFEFAKGGGVQGFPQTPQPAQTTRPSLPPAPVGALRVSGRVMQQLVVKRVDPIYPAEGIPLDAKGDVLLVAVVSQTGEVQEVEPLSGPSIFRQPAMEAVKQWRFTPYTNDGQPVSVQTTILLHFERPR